VVLSAWPVAVPFTVTVAVPVVAFAAAVRVSADELPVALCGSNAAVTPVGRPVAVSAISPSKPPVLVMLTVCIRHTRANPWEYERALIFLPLTGRTTDA